MENPGTGGVCIEPVGTRGPPAGDSPPELALVPYRIFSWTSSNASCPAHLPQKNSVLDSAWGNRYFARAVLGRQGRAVEPCRRKGHRSGRRRDKGVGLVIRTPGGYTLPAASLHDLQPRRASWRGLGCGCVLGEACGAGEGGSSGPTTGQGLGQVLGRTRAEDRPRGQVQRKHLGRRRRTAERCCPGNRTALRTAS